MKLGVSRIDLTDDVDIRRRVDQVEIRSHYKDQWAEVFSRKWLRSHPCGKSGPLVSNQRRNAEMSAENRASTHLNRDSGM